MARILKVDNPGEAAREVLKNGGIIAIKGVGGYHLACDAFNEEIVAQLRSLKGRDNRAFAVMFKDLEILKAHCQVSELEAQVLTGFARPITLLKQEKDSGLAKSVNLGLREIGAFLPYTGIQLLLFNESLTALVMTSGNRSGEPLIVDDNEVIHRLGPMVDGFLGHNRSIVWGCDDSVIRVQQGKIIGIRRSRGFVPSPIKVSNDLIPALACGAGQKNTFGLTKGRMIYLSPHQGDLDEAASYLAYQKNIEKYIRLLDCKPEWAIHDLHPDYHSTIYALNSGLKTIAVQHHLAHLAGVIAAQNISGPVIGVIFDGSGYGTDYRIWGGEFFAGEGCKWQRLGHLKYIPLPGGEAAIQEPWRMGAIYLRDTITDGLLTDWLRKLNMVHKWEQLNSAIKMGVNCPETSSVGRLFDGVAAITGGITQVSYEGEAAVWLENQADRTASGIYNYCIEIHQGVYRIDPSEIAAQVFRDLGLISSGAISMKFHRTVAAFIAEVAQLIRVQTDIKQIVLSGGVFQNRLLLNLTWDLLTRKGFVVYVPEIVPINDGGIALGQAWLGSLMVERGVSDVFSDTR